MNMVKYILRRILLMVIVLAGVSVITFGIAHNIPGDPLAANLGQTAMSDPTIVAAYTEKWGLDKPVTVQYFNYVKNFLSGDWGTSIRTKRPVLEDLAEAIPATFEMATLATIFPLCSACFSAFSQQPSTISCRIMSCVSCHWWAFPSLPSGCLS
jgi:peptide ABC transporter, permease protein